MIEDFYADAIDTVSTSDIDPRDFTDTVNAYWRFSCVKRRPKKHHWLV